MKFLLTLFFGLLFVPTNPLYAQTTPFRNGGFENGGANSVPDWSPYEGGYDVDRDTKHNGNLAVRFDNANASLLKGASQRVTLNQTSPVPIQISGWSKAENVDGVKNADYSLYADLTYTDGTSLYGENGAFHTGTHDWERRRFVIFPQKPVRELTVYVLFRRHRGTAWFDDVSLRELRGSLFDGQILTFPARKPTVSEPAKTISTREGKDGKNSLTLGFDAGGGIGRVTDAGETLTGSTGGGFFLRDVKNQGEIVPLRGQLSSRANGGLDLIGGAAGVRYNLRVEPQKDNPSAISLDAELIDTTKTDRALTLYFAIPVNATGWSWGDDLRTSRKITAGNEYTEQARVSVGATGGASVYPFCEVNSSSHGIGIASQMEWASTYRLFYHADLQLLVIAWDIALTGKTATWPPYNARARATVFSLKGGLAKWGFRAAVSRFYALNPTGYTRRAKQDGIWLPFTDPTKIPHPEDFGFAYHEGDNSVKTDDALGILSFRYTEPASYWLPMPADTPRTYENVLKILKDAGLPPTALETQRKIQESERFSPTQSRKAVKRRGDDILLTSVSSVQSVDRISFVPSVLPLCLCVSSEASGEIASRISHLAKLNAASARAVFNSGIKDENGRYVIEFRREPWNDGALILLNPNPELPASDAQPTRGWLAYNLADAVKRYGDKTQTLDGEYLDSLEQWGDTLDFRAEHLKTCPYPVPFETDSFAPCVPEWYNVHTFTRFLRDDLRNRNKLLFANTTPVRYNAFSALLDVMGIEVNWLDAKGKFSPDTDAVMNLRRTLSAKKPYLLLMNTDFDKFGHAEMERYFQACLFYGIFPSCFSANAADHPYWKTKSGSSATATCSKNMSRKSKHFQRRVGSPSRWRRVTILLSGGTLRHSISDGA